MHLLLKLINEHGLNLQTNTVVEKVVEESDGTHLMPRTAVVF